MSRTLPHECKPRQRCNNHAQCTQCARIRQARIADRAEALLRDYLQLQLIIVRPAAAPAGPLIKAVQQCIRSNGLRAGVWTIERGPKTGLLHANILSHDGPVRNPPGHLATAEPVRHGVRATAAYISKISQAPGREHYSGRTYGAWGHVTDWLADCNQETTILAAMAERAIQPPGYEPAPPEPALRAGPHVELTTDQYREIAARHLPNLAAISDQFKRR